MNQKDFFLHHGFFLIEKLVNVFDIKDILPQEKNSKFCYSKYSKSFLFLEEFENGIVRNNNPYYNELSYSLKNFLKSTCNFDLYPSFHYDNFLFENQSLIPNTENSDVSVLLKISDNLKSSHILNFKDFLKNQIVMQMNCGDVFVFSSQNIFLNGTTKKNTKLSESIKKIFQSNMKEKYSHYVIFNYVYQYGENVEYAFKYQNF